MSKEQEALKLALDALNVVKLQYTQNRHVNEAIAAIKEALAQPDYRAVKTYHEGKPVYVSQPAQEPNKISTEELMYMAGVYDGKVLEREACAKVCESYLSESPHSWGGTTTAAAIRARSGGQK